MAFSSQDTDEVLSEINITPLVDVMLVLLVAFIITIPVINNAVHINLPKTLTTSPPDPEKTITISIDRDSRLYIDRREIAATELEAELASLKSAHADLSLQLQGDETVPYGPVARAMATIERSGISRVSVLTAQQ